MSDPGSWQAPAGSPWAAPGAVPPPAAPAPPPPSFGGPPPGVGAPPPFGDPGPVPGRPAFGAPAVWTPPPKPGLIPLRPLSLGDVLGAAFQVLRRNPKPTFGFALVMSLAIALGSGVLTAVFIAFAIGRVASASAADQAAITAGSVAIGILGFVVAMLLTIAASTLVQGVIAVEVVRAALGEKHTLSGLWAAAKGRLMALIGWTLLATAIAGVVGAVLVVLLALAIGLVAVAVGEVAGIVTAVIVSILFGLAAIAAGLWLWTKLAFVPVAIVVERLGIIAAVRRSWTMTRPHFWRILGTLLLMSVILSLAQQIISIPLTVLAPFVQILVDPNGSPETGVVLGLILTVLALALISVITAISLVAQSATPPLLYLDTRMRVEGLDLQLQRLVEDRAAGRPVPANPYLPPAV